MFLSCEDLSISSFHRSANMWIFIYLKSLLRKNCSFTFFLIFARVRCSSGPFCRFPGMITEWRRVSITTLWSLLIEKTICYFWVIRIFPLNGAKVQSLSFVYSTKCKLNLYLQTDIQNIYMEIERKWRELPFPF